MPELTKQEIRQTVREAIRDHSSCNIFTPDEVVMIKRRLKTIDKIANTIGYVVIGLGVVGATALVALGSIFKFGGK